MLDLGRLVLALEYRVLSGDDFPDRLDPDCREPDREPVRREPTLERLGLELEVDLFSIFSYLGPSSDSLPSRLSLEKAFDSTLGRVSSSLVSVSLLISLLFFVSCCELSGELSNMLPSPFAPPSALTKLPDFEALSLP